MRMFNCCAKNGDFQRKGLVFNTYPVLSFELAVERGGGVSSDSRRESIDNDQGGEECSSVVWIEHSNK